MEQAFQIAHVFLRIAGFTLALKFSLSNRMCVCVYIWGEGHTCVYTCVAFERGTNWEGRPFHCFQDVDSDWLVIHP